MTWFFVEMGIKIFIDKLRKAKPEDARKFHNISARVAAAIEEAYKTDPEFRAAVEKAKKEK